MTLNVTAAMVISSGCIAGMFWYVQSQDVQRAADPSPLASGEVVLATSDPLPMHVDDWSDPVAEPQWRRDVANRLATASPVERELDRNRDAAPALPVAAVTPVSTSEQTITLPPLAYEWPEDAAVAEALGPEGLPLEDEVPMESGQPVVRLAGASAEQNLVEEEPAIIEKAPEPVYREYIVESGDNLSRIARREYGSCRHEIIDALMEHNPRIRARDGHLRIGEVLLLPDEATLYGEDAKAGQRLADATEGGRWYTIRPNDSLSSIARRELHDASRWREILELNRDLKDKDRIYPGMKIKLPPPVRVVRG